MPRNSVIFVGAVALIGAFVLGIVAGYRTYSLGSTALTWNTFKQIMNGGEAYGLGAEMLNFGALIAFMGVNVAALLRYYVRAEEKKLTYLVPPVLRIPHLPRIVGEPQPSCNDCGIDLDGGGNSVWRDQDQRLPWGLDQFRIAPRGGVSFRHARLRKHRGLRFDH